MDFHRHSLPPSLQARKDLLERADDVLGQPKVVLPRQPVMVQPRIGPDVVAAAGSQGDYHRERSPRCSISSIANSILGPQVGNLDIEPLLARHQEVPDGEMRCQDDMAISMCSRDFEGQSQWMQALARQRTKGATLVNQRRASQYQPLVDEMIEVEVGESYKMKRKTSRGFSLSSSTKKVRRGFGSISESVKGLFTRRDSGQEDKDESYVARNHPDAMLESGYPPDWLPSMVHPRATSMESGIVSPRASVGTGPRTLDSWYGHSTGVVITCDGQAAFPNMIESSVRTSPCSEQYMEAMSPVNTRVRASPPKSSDSSDLLEGLWQAVERAHSNGEFRDGRREAHFAVRNVEPASTSSEDSWEASMVLKKLAADDERARMRRFRRACPEPAHKARPAAEVEDGQSHLARKRRFTFAACRDDDLDGLVLGRSMTEAHLLQGYEGVSVIDFVGTAIRETGTGAV